jgi:hypothetical protein
MTRASALALALVLAACTGTGVSRTEVVLEEREPPPQRGDWGYEFVDGLLLVAQPSSGNEGTGIGETLLIYDDGLVRYVATRPKKVRIYRTYLTGDQFSELRATIESRAFATMPPEFRAPPEVHDAGADALSVMTPSGRREIAYNRRYAELAPPLEDLLTVVDAAFSRFSSVNPWKVE